MSKNIIIGSAQTRPHKQHLRGPVFALILSILGIVWVAFCLTGSAQPATQQSSVALTRNGALVAATNEVLKETSEIRQLAILRPVQSSAQSREEIERMIVKNLDEETTPARMHATEVTLKTLGLVPPDFNFRSLMIRLLTEQVAGYYDPKVQQFHLADWIDIDGQRPIMAHELTHALQDQHFNLRRFEHWPKGDSDAELTAHALIEGDATLSMSFYVANNPLRALALLKSLGATGLTSQELEKAPRSLRETLLFPYQEGLNWTRTVYRYGGWRDVSQAFTTLPQSTEQILHPEKYFVHEPPVKVLLPDLTEVLNRTNERSEIRNQRSDISQDKSVSRLQSLASWKKIDSDVNGEWGLYLILDEFLNSAAESRRAAAGWGGDRYAVYENRDGRVIYVSLTSWDTERDAREFFDAYMKRTQLRYPNARTETDSPDSKRLQNPMGETAIQIRGTRILVAEGLPDTMVERALVKALGMNN